MREIKFRGKRVDNGELVYGYVVFSQDKLNAWISESKEDDWTIKGQNEVIPETVGQYTGLKDKNGVNIYEGDIIKFSLKKYGGEWEVRCAVKFVNGQFRAYDSTLFAVHSICEVIDNIHDNPELLEG